MNIKSFSVSAVMAAVLSCGANLRAVTSPAAQILSGDAAVPSQFQPVAFSDSAEAGMLHRAYRILATGDHDYKGHRVKAMHAVEAAARLLGLDLSASCRCFRTTNSAKPADCCQMCLVRPKSKARSASPGASTKPSIKSTLRCPSAENIGAFLN